MDKFFSATSEITVPKSKKLLRVVLSGILFAVALVLSFVENSLPLPVPVPGVKLGLSNIVVMYVLFFLGKKEAYLIAVLKAVFVFITRGPVASILSFSGGILSLTIMVVLLFVFKEKLSYLILSIAGSIFHNLGQLIVVSMIYTGLLVPFYLPILFVSGIVAGIATSTLLSVFIPAVKMLGLK